MKSFSKLLIPAASILLIGFYFSLSHLLYQPRPWSDEAIYHQMVMTHHQTGEFGIPMWKGLLLETEIHNYWYPPFFFSLLSAYARIVTLDLESQRLLSVFFAMIAALSFLYLSYVYTKTNYFWIPIASFLTDFIWLRGSRMSRPEALILALGGVSLVLLHLYTKTRKKTLFVGAIVLAASAQLSHYYGLWTLIVGFLYLWFYSKKYRKKAIIFGIASFLPLVIWWLQLYPNWNVLWNHTFLGVENKTSIEPITFLANRTNTLPLKIQFSLLQIVGFISICYLAKDNKYRWLSASLGMIWAMIFVGRMFWYTVYVIPFTYLMWHLIYRKLPPSKYKNLWTAIGIVTLVINLQTFYVFGKEQEVFQFDFETYSKVVAESVPENSKVFLTASPETYYGFYTYNPSVDLIMYPAVTTTEEDYKAVLDSVDYVVFTGDYVDRIFGNFLPNYLQENTESYISIAKPYQEEIILMKMAR